MLNGIALCAGRLIPCAGLLAGMMMVGPVDAGFAASPNVIFDSSVIVTCTDVTPSDFAFAHPGEKVIEARFRVSALLEQGSANDIEEVLLVIQSPERRLRVVDFAPKTELTTDVTGEIEVVETSEDTETLDASIGGTVSVDYGVVKAKASPAVGGGNTQRNILTEKYHRIPPKELLLSSGTTNNEHGVFFKLRPSSQTSLEGMREYTCRFAVPEGWRGDWVMLQCHAKGYSGVGVFRSLEACGYRRAYVGLYLAGDAEAQMAAVRLAEAQGVLIESIASQKAVRSNRVYLVMKPLISHRSTDSNETRDSLSLPALFRFCRREEPSDTSTPAGEPTAVPPSPGNQFEHALNELREFTGGQHLSDGPAFSPE